MSISIYEITKDWSERAGLACFAEPQVSSTNDLAKERALQETEALSLYVTDHQTKGRGRFDRTWTDVGQGDFLLSSWSFMLLHAPQPTLAPALGLALYKAAVATWLGFGWSLKAPNDLYLGDRKVAGLLIESVQEGSKFRLVVGLGMNVMAHPGIERSGSLAEQIPAEEITPEIWRQFLDRLLLELTSTLLLGGAELQQSQQRGLLFALNLFPDARNGFIRVFADGSLETAGQKKIPWSEI